MGKALFVIDLENEWINEQSEYYIGDMTQLVENVNRLIEFERNNGTKILFIRHVEKDSTEAFAENSPNTELIGSLQRNDTDTIITKYKINPFYMTDLEKALEGIDEIILCGVLTNLCVRMSAEEAYDRDYGVTILADCCMSYDAITHTFTLDDLVTTRPEIVITELSEYIQQ